MKAAVLNLHDKMEHAMGMAATNARLAAALNLQVMNFRIDNEILASAAERRS